jgi:hypothetical protein
LKILDESRLLFIFPLQRINPLAEQQEFTLRLPLRVPRIKPPREQGLGQIQAGREDEYEEDEGNNQNAGVRKTDSRFLFQVLFFANHQLILGAESLGYRFFGLQSPKLPQN